jgi:superfamily II DNA or RNA helicase
MSAGSAKTVKFRRKDHLLRVQPLIPEVRRILMSELTYKRTKFHATYQERKNNDGRSISIYSVECYRVESLGTTSKQKRDPAFDCAVCCSGFMPKLTEAFKKRGYEIDYKDFSKPFAKPIKPDWANLSKYIELRPGQREVLEQIIANDRGMIHWPTGAGKSYLIQALSKLYPGVKILLTTRYQAVLLDHFAKLSDLSAAVGIICSAKKKHGDKILVCSSGCLHKALHFKPDILIADEVHELATDAVMPAILQFRPQKMLAFSANHRDRMDNADFELEGIFGPRIATMSYSEAVDKKLVVPIRVRLTPVTDGPTVSPQAPRFIRERNLIWQNDFRNKLIAKDAREFPDDQVLIVVNTINHAYRIAKYLPDFTVVYSPKDAAGFKEAKEDGIIPRSAKRLTTEKLHAIKRQFESGKLKKAIVTSVWNRGVNFHKLAVLIRAGADGSKISAIQVSGRLSRLSQGKDYGLLIDYTDEWDDPLRGRSESRVSYYRKQGWQCYRKKPKKRLLRRKNKS